MAKKPILTIELDNCLHSMTSGWLGHADLPDEPVPGAQEFCQKALEHFEVYIVSPRTLTRAGREAITAWLVKHQFPTGLMLWEVEAPPPAFLSLSARALLFTGTFPDDPRTLLSFRPWNRKGSKVNQPSPLWLAVKQVYDEAMETLLEDGQATGAEIISKLNEILKENQ